MEKTYVGIDPGEEGFISVQKNGKWEFFSLKELDNIQIGEIFRQLKEDNEHIAAVMEDVHAIFGASAKSTFNFGFNKGMLYGLLCGFKIPLTLVPPKEWQNLMWTNNDKEYDIKVSKKNGEEKSRKMVNTKKTSTNCCRRLFPELDLRRNTRCTKFDDNKIDSILICEYGRRKNL